MKKPRVRRPSPAMIVAVLALSLSLVGTGAAATISALNQGEKRVVKKLSRKIANKRITKRAPKVAALANVVARAGTPVPIPAGGTADAFANCNPGETLVGGGGAPVGVFGAPGTGNTGFIQFNGPDLNVPNQWQMKAYSAGGATLRVTAYCQR